MVARLQQTSQNSCGMVKSEQQVSVVVHHYNRLRLPIAGTAAVALSALPLAFSPASAAIVSQETSSDIGVMETASSTSRFNLGVGSAHRAIEDGDLAQALTPEEQQQSAYALLEKAFKMEDVLGEITKLLGDRKGQVLTPDELVDNARTTQAKLDELSRIIADMKEKLR